MFADTPDGYGNVLGDDCIPGDVAAHMPLVDSQLSGEAPLGEARTVYHPLKMAVGHFQAPDTFRRIVSLQQYTAVCQPLGISSS